ncbi:MAG: HD-GYP domain-containing protein [Planctomycetes bacterium]|nr:HD-GYP domain-containing protein [Planctomycetota bacterium]
MREPKTMRPPPHTRPAGYDTRRVASALNRNSLASSLVSELRVAAGRLHQGRSQLQQAHHDTILGFLAALEARDAYTHRHSIHVSVFADALAHRCKLAPAQIHTIHIAALLHDIGKIGIPDAILLKPGRLTSEEFEAMKKHSEIGAAMLRPIPSLSKESLLVLHHHEWFNGAGYPHRLAGNAIPIGSRILQVADSMDAMLSPRNYKPGYDITHIVDELRKGAGQQFDPIIARIAIAWLETHPDELALPV